MSLAQYVVASEFTHHHIPQGEGTVFAFKRTFTLHAPHCGEVADRSWFPADRRGSSTLAALHIHGIGSNGALDPTNAWEPVWLTCPTCGTNQIPEDTWRDMAAIILAVRKVAEK